MVGRRRLGQARLRESKHDRQGLQTESSSMKAMYSLLAHFLCGTRRTATCAALAGLLHARRKGFSAWNVTLISLLLKFISSGTEVV